MPAPVAQAFRIKTYVLDLNVFFDFRINHKFHNSFSHLIGHC